MQITVNRENSQVVRKEGISVFKNTWNIDYCLIFRSYLFQTKYRLAEALEKICIEKRIELEFIGNTSISPVL